MPSRLVDHLRALPDDGLAALLTLRPDLVVPVPTDIAVLAHRAQGRASMARALDGLDQFTLEILDGLRYVRDEDGIASLERLLTLTSQAGAEPADVRRAVDRLRARFVIFGIDGFFQLALAVDEVTSPFPAGLGRPAEQLDPATAKLVADPAGLRRTIMAAPPEARAILDRLATGGSPVGTMARKSPDSPGRWLLDHGLLVAMKGDDTVELPREIGLLLRRETGPLGHLHPRPPQVEAPSRPGADSAGAGQALEAVRHLEAVLAELAGNPAPRLRSGGMGVRDLRRLARVAGLTEPVTALLLEVAHAAGLLGETDGSRDGEPRWLPTIAFDAWREAPLARRWAVVARAYLSMTRAPSLVGLRDDKDKPINALAIEVTRTSAPATRRATLGVLAELPELSALPAEAVLDRLGWLTPRRVGAAGPARDLHRAALAEAATLGITGLDALTSYGRVLLGERPDAESDDPLGLRDEPADTLVAALDALLPPPVDHVLVQADLTVVVPGPPEPALAAELALVADAESRGGATVYRVTTDSVRRALDAGWSVAQIQELFSHRSRTPVPQALSYLVDDVARRHGGIRVGAAHAYLRSDDEALVSEVLADRRLAALGLRRLAPTVVISAAAPGRLLDLLREAGYAPAHEDAGGALVVTASRPARAPARPVHPVRSDDFNPPPLRGPRLAGVVEQIRLGERVARATRNSPLNRTLIDADGTPVTASQAHAQAMAVLAQAIRDQATVWVGFVDAHGTKLTKLVKPLSIGSGYLRAEDSRAEMTHTFALHRITSAIPADPSR